MNIFKHWITYTVLLGVLVTLASCKASQQNSVMAPARLGLASAGILYTQIDSIHPPAKSGYQTVVEYYKTLGLKSIRVYRQTLGYEGETSWTFTLEELNKRQRLRLIDLIVEIGNSPGSKDLVRSRYITQMESPALLPSAKFKTLPIN